MSTSIDRLLRKIVSLDGDPSLVQLIRYGASRDVGGVSVASVPAVHSNGLSPASSAITTTPRR